MNFRNLLWAFCTSISFSALAQENLSLSSAVEKTLSQNFDIQLINSQIEINKINNTWEAAGKYPTFSIGLNQNNSLNNIIKPAPFQLQGVIINQGVVPNLAVNWILFNGFGVRIEKARLGILQKQSEGNAAALVQTSLQNVIVSYYQIQLLQSQTKLLEKIMLLSRQKYDYVVFKKQIGGATVNEIWQEENNYLADSVALTNQKLAVRNAVRNLNLLMAEKEPEKTYNFTDTLALTTEKYDFESLQEKMLSNNINLKNQLLVEELLRNNVADAKASQSPLITFSATSAYNLAFQNLDNAQRPDGSSASSSTGSIMSHNNAAGFALTMPILNNSLVRRNIQTAKVQLKMGEIQTAQLKLRLSNLLRQTLDQYQVRQQLQTIAQRNEKIALDNLVLAAERFKTGKINTFEYRILQENYLNVAANYLQTLYQVIETKTALAVLTGSIVEEK
jgi:outer membrane protein TolC